MDQPERLVQQLEWFQHLHGDTLSFFQSQLRAMTDVVAEVLQDGLGHLAPVLLMAGQDVSTMRRNVGRAAWRRIHHADTQTNFMRALVRHRYGEDASWPEIAALPEVHLRSCRNALDWKTARTAARLAEPGRFSQTMMLLRDVVKMGGTADRDWTLPQLKKAHSKLSTKTAIETADPTVWCRPFEFSKDGYAFQRLTSDRDFVTEGKALRHCVATYRNAARSGSTVVLRCTGRERATLRFSSEGDSEMSGFANAPVSERSKQASKAAIAAFLNSCNGSADHEK